jgi:hypothetical protein
MIWSKNEVTSFNAQLSSTQNQEPQYFSHKARKARQGKARQGKKRREEGGKKEEKEEEEEEEEEV